MVEPIPEYTRDKTIPVTIPEATRDMTLSVTFPEATRDMTIPVTVSEATRDVSLPETTYARLQAAKAAMKTSTIEKTIERLATW